MLAISASGADGGHRARRRKIAADARYELLAQGDGAGIARAARKAGLLMRPLGDVIIFMPPLSITEAEIDTLLNAALLGINEVTASRKLKRMDRRPRFLISGTDTGVGKTTVGCGLAAGLANLACAWAL